MAEDQSHQAAGLHRRLAKPLNNSETSSKDANEKKNIPKAVTHYLTGGGEKLMKQAKEAVRAFPTLATGDDDDSSNMLEEMYEKLLYTNKIIVKPFEEVFEMTKTIPEMGTHHLFVSEKRDTASKEDEPLLPKRTAEESMVMEPEPVAPKDSNDEPVQMILRNGSAIMGLAIIVLCSITYSQKSEIQVPLNVAGSWFMAAFILGYMVSTRRHTEHENKELELELERRKSVLLSVRTGAEVSEPTMTARHSSSLPPGFWTALHKEPAEIQVCDLLKERVLKYTSPDGKSVRQLLRLRGTDMFLSERPEEQLWKDQLLLKCGLRDRPTFFVNAIFPWGSYLVYFDLPPWVQKFSDVVEEESDADDIKALKRVLKGDTEYRNSRLYCMPVITEANVAVRMVAPNRNEFKVSAGRAPVTWSQDDMYTDMDGKTRHAVLELAIDCMSDKMIRNFISFMRPFLVTMTCEAAVLIDKPFESKEEEPSAFVSFFKWEKVDLAKCPVLPPKSEEENVRRASLYLSHQEAVAVVAS